MDSFMDSFIFGFHSDTAYEHGKKHGMQNPDADYVQLVDDHWKYIGQLLGVHQVSPNGIRLVGTIYTARFIIGFADGARYAKKIRGGLTCQEAATLSLSHKFAYLEADQHAKHNN